MKSFQKTINGQKYKGKVFEESDVINKFNRSKDEWELIDKYQKTFPQLLIDDVEGFVIDARTLWEELGQPQGAFNKFIKRKVIDVFEENSDYITMGKFDHGRNDDFKLDHGKNKVKNSDGTFAEINYTLTLETAKNLAMGVGTTKNASVETRERGNLVRKYFMLIEKVLKEYERWVEVREPEKEGYKVMKLAIHDWCVRNGYDVTIDCFYTREADMLNECLTGFKARDLRFITKTKDNNTRDNLNTEINKALSMLQFTNTALLNNNLDFESRKNMIKTTCDTMYSHIKEMV